MCGFIDQLGKGIYLYAKVDNWERENPAIEPIVTVYPYQPYIKSHVCHPAAYDHLGLVMLKTIQQRIDISPEKPPHEIYEEVYDLILKKFGPVGDNLTEDEESILNLIRASLTPWTSLRRNLYRYKATHLPRNPSQQSDFDPNHSFNFLGDENICKYAGKIDDTDDNSWVLIFATEFTLSLIHAAKGLFVDGNYKPSKHY